MIYDVIFCFSKMHDSVRAAKERDLVKDFRPVVVCMKSQRGFSKISYEEKIVVLLNRSFVVEINPSPTVRKTFYSKSKLKLKG